MLFFSGPFQQSFSDPRVPLRALGNIPTSWSGRWGVERSTLSIPEPADTCSLWNEPVREDLALSSQVSLSTLSICSPCCRMRTVYFPSLNRSRRSWGSRMLLAWPASARLSAVLAPGEPCTSAPSTAGAERGWGRGGDSEASFLQCFT